MKKLIPVLCLALVAAVGAFFVLKKVTLHVPRAAELVPAETVLFLQVPDALRSVQRFTKTAMWQIFKDPEMQEFVGTPPKEAPVAEEASRIGERVLRVVPREGFLAITSVDGPVPTFVAGFAYSGRQKDAEALMAEWRKQVRGGWPAGKADLVTIGTREIETFTDKDFVLAEVFCDGWYFIADDLELLEKTIERLDGKADIGTSLAASAIFKEATAPLPPLPDALMVAQLGTVMERLTSLMVASGQKNDPKELDELKATKALAAATKFDGEQCRDTIFVMRPGGVKEAPLARNALALSSPATLLYYAMMLPAKIELSEQTAPMLALIPGFSVMNEALAERGLSLGDFPAAFGPEMGSLLEWRIGDESPVFLLALDVRDREKAAAFVNVFASEWTKSERLGVTLLTAPADPASPNSPTIALTENFVVFGMSPEMVRSGIAQLRTGSPRLDATAGFASSVKAVVVPTGGFGYIDLRTLFERSYSTLKPLLGMVLAMAPEVGQYMDAGKLPPAGTISKYLGPIVYSQATTEQGTIVESTGPLTFNQILLVAAAGAIKAALPAMQSALAGGAGLDPAQLLQGLNPATPPSPAETAPETPPAQSVEPAEENSAIK